MGGNRNHANKCIWRCRQPSMEFTPPAERKPAPVPQKKVKQKWAPLFPTVVEEDTTPLYGDDAEQDYQEKLLKERNTPEARERGKAIWEQERRLEKEEFDERHGITGKRLADHNKDSKFTKKVTGTITSVDAQKWGAPAQPKVKKCQKCNGTKRVKRNAAWTIFGKPYANCRCKKGTEIFVNGKWEAVTGTKPKTPTDDLVNRFKQQKLLE